MKEAEYYIQDETEGLNKRIDDAFTELDTQRNRMSGLTRENSELRQEVSRLEDRVNEIGNLIKWIVLIYLFNAIMKLILVLVT